MKHRTLTLATLLSLASSACAVDGVDTDELDLAEAEELDDELVDDGLEIENAIEVNQQELARIEVEHGAVVFLVDVDGPDAGSVTMLEELEPDAEGMFTSIAGERTALQTFLVLTAADVPVPEALVDVSVDDDAIDQADLRGAVERHDTTLYAEGRQLTADSDPQAWSGPFMCSEGNTSAQFAAEICSATVWDKNFCHNGYWHTVTDDSHTGTNLNAHWSRSRTLACGYTGRARHYYRSGGIWYKPIDRNVPVNNMYRFTHEGLIRLRRQITHSRYGAGFVRGASHFQAW